jgi:HPt (histidine-containing phosphotransfer) domain-containing protein
MNDYVSKPIRVEALVEALVRGAEAAGIVATEPEAEGVEILDPAALDSLRDVVGDDDEFFAELVTTFLDDAPQLLSGLRTALEASDAAEVRRFAHSLKSNGAEFGASAFSQSCHQLETDAKGGDLASAEALVTQIEVQFVEVESALRELLAASGRGA